MRPEAKCDLVRDKGGNLHRRAFLKGSAALAATAVAGFRLPLAHAADYRGRLCVFVQADGGWDPTSFCDPKANTPGEPVINHWAESKEIGQKYHRRMLVINGVDAQTNSHTVGIVHNWSGRNSEGYDTHARNDAGQGWLLANLTDGLDYLWEYAERHGIADRLFVVVGSDFGRTNFYNADDGKDHWPIGSYVVMEKGRGWTNRVVGETDGLHFAQRINPRTLRRDDRNGTIIYPKHVHKALRRYLGVDRRERGFPFNNMENFGFFI